MAITTEQIKALREATGAGILDCRKALEQSNGDFDKAFDFLREKGLATALKRSDREASEGVVELYSHGGGRGGVMVEVNCETDFVARSENFRHFAHEVALQIAAGSPGYLRAEDVPAEVLEHERDIARARAREERKPASVWPRSVYELPDFPNIVGRVRSLFSLEACAADLRCRKAFPISNNFSAQRRIRS